jgi:peptidoglycan hydrolase-like protein with peptidoglycan-binding domain
MLLRRPARSRIGHIAISLGNRRQTVEAKDAQSGIVIGKADPDLRGWEFGVRIPTAQEWATLTRRASAPDNWFLREVTSRVEDPRVAEVQLSLSKKRAWSKPITGVFGAETSKSIAEFQKKQNLVVDGMVGAQTSRALGINWNKIASASGTYNAKYDVFFDALVPGKFYSSDPDILSVKRSIRTNNPGALNFSAWQRSMKGYVSLTPPDSAGNRTTIYRTPEHGVAAWYELIANRYGFGQAGSFTLAQLARKYAGPRASQQAVNTYVQGWSRASGGALTADTIFRTASDSEMLALGRAMFFHEIGRASPLHDDQVRYGIQKQRAKSMPD